MDPDRFIHELAGLFESFPESELPRDPRFGEILEQVPGLAKPNNLALINHAASLLDVGECYVEVGTFRGTSLIAALLGNDGDFVGIDSFSMGEGNREALDTNLARFGLEGRADVLEGDAFELIPAGALGDRSVGVYYYDAAHDYQSQLDGLRMIEPHLAPRALILVDDTDWEQVSRATHDYLAGQHHARLLLEIPGEEKADRPQWWKGMMALKWEAAWRSTSRR